MRDREYAWKRGNHPETKDGDCKGAQSHLGRKYRLADGLFAQSQRGLQGDGGLKDAVVQVRAVEIQDLKHHENRDGGQGADDDCPPPRGLLRKGSAHVASGPRFKSTHRRRFYAYNTHPGAVCFGSRVAASRNPFLGRRLRRHVVACDFGGGETNKRGGAYWGNNDGYLFLMLSLSVATF